MSINLEAGSYTIDILQTVGAITKKKINMGYKLKKQILRIKGYRVHMETNGDALVTGVLYVDIMNTNGQTILSGNHLIDNNVNSLEIGLELDHAIVTNVGGTDRVISMATDAKEELLISAYRLDVTSQTMIPEDKILRLTINFETEFGSIA